jgi:hypothetical protein
VSIQVACFMGMYEYEYQLERKLQGGRYQDFIVPGSTSTLWPIRKVLGTIYGPLLEAGSVTAVAGHSHTADAGGRVRTRAQTHRKLGMTQWAPQKLRGSGIRIGWSGEVLEMVIEDFLYCPYSSISSVTTYLVIIPSMGQLGHLHLHLHLHRTAHSKEKMPCISSNKVACHVHAPSPFPQVLVAACLLRLRRQMRGDRFQCRQLASAG